MKEDDQGAEVSGQVLPSGRKVYHVRQHRRLITDLADLFQCRIVSFHGVAYSQHLGVLKTGLHICQKCSFFSLHLPLESLIRTGLSTGIDNREHNGDCCQYADNCGIHGTLSMITSDAFMAIHPTKINSFSVFSQVY